MKRRNDVAIESVYQTYDVIKSIYNLFIKAKMMASNPFQGALEKKSHTKKQKRDILTDEELKTLLDYKKDDRIQFLFICSLYTGLRLSDCCLLKWANVDWGQNLLKVIPLKTQRHMADPIHIPIHPLLMKELEKAMSKRKGKDEYVYEENAMGYKNKKVNYSVSSIFHKLKLNLKKKTFHSLRHTFISNAANNGTSIQVLQKLVGHSSVNMSMAYYHENRKVLDNAINTLPDYSKSQSDEIEVVRLPKDLITSIRSKGVEGESIVDTLKRIVDGVEKVEQVEHNFRHDEVDALIAEIQAKMDAA